MGLSDKSRRIKQIPFRASWWDASSFGNQFDDEGISITGDITCIRTGNGAGGLIRLTRPAKGDLLSARLTMVAVTPPTGFVELRFGVGTFAADGITAVAPDEVTLAAQWKKLTGNSAPWSYGTQDNVFVDGLDFGPLIPKRGDPDFNEDGWPLYVDLLSKDGPTGWVLYRFLMDCSVQLGAL